MVTYSQTVVWAEVGGAMRLARNARAWVSDPVTGDPVDATQGARTASYVDTDADGRCDFTAASWPVRIASSLATGAPSVIVMPVEAPTLLGDAVSGAAASAATASAAVDTIDETIATWAADTSDATVASLVGGSTSTRTALDGAYGRIDGASGLVLDATTTGMSPSATAAANTTALGAACTSAATLGATVFIPAGAYSINATTITAPVRGAGRAATVLTGATITIGAANVTISDLKHVSSSATALSCAHHAGVTLARVEVAHTAGVTTAHLGIDAYDVDQLRVIECTFNIGGVQLSLCDDFLIQGNLFSCGYLNTNEPIHVSGQSAGIVANNTITQTATDGIDLYSSGHRCVIIGNRLYGLRGASGIECKVTMSDDPNNTSGPGNVLDGTIIANNILRDFSATASSTRSGIFAEYVDNRATPAFSVAETNRAVMITGNVIEDMNVADPGAGVTISYQAIAFTGHNGLITNNIIRHIRGWQSAVPMGIVLAQPSGTKCVGVRVAGNVIAGVDAANGSAGIQVGTLDRCQIDGNIVRGDEVNSLQTRWGVSIVAGATVSDSSISGNTFECNHASGYGIRTGSSTASLVRCRVQGNTFVGCGASIASAQACSFALNVLDNATNSNSFGVGTAGTSSRGNTFHGNHFTMSSDYALVLTDVDGFVITGNSFKDTARGLLLIGGTRKGLVDNNLSISQASGAEFPHYSGVSGGDQATITVGANLVTT